MAIKKKIVWLLYDADTAIATNNEGQLVFDYNLEDTDHMPGGAEIYNGQNSVFWNNIRKAFPDELKKMYQSLRTSGALSYSKTEQMFEEHQSKWPEAIFNEDAQFKYLDPLLDDGDASYLSMLQGSKAEQRKWWLYNRFRYLDSKYNAGDALSDVITLRGYAKDNITVTPYADVYPAVKYGSYLVTERGKRNVATTLICPLDKVNDTEIYVYSASQLASIGDISGLKVGYADFSKATKLKELKIGDSSATYDNPNLTELHLGNNRLLRKLDVRNCSKLATSVDASGCVGLQEAYFEGTAITALVLPDGGEMQTLHLPETVTNLTIRNHPSLSNFRLTNYSQLTSVWLENSLMDREAMTILYAMTAGTRIRCIGFNWTFGSYTAVKAFLDKLDTLKGLDEHGYAVEKAQVRGTIRIQGTITQKQKNELTSRYPSITIEATVRPYTVRWISEDTVLQTDYVQHGGSATFSGTPTHSGEAADWRFDGWDKTAENVTEDMDITAKWTSLAIMYKMLTEGTGSKGKTLRNSIAKSMRGNALSYSPWREVILENVTDFGNESSSYMTIGKLRLPNVTSIPNNAFAYYLAYQETSGANVLYRCTDIFLPKVTQIGSGVFGNAVGITARGRLVIGTQADTTICALTGTFSSAPTKIYVPDALVDDYKAATNWSTYASKIYPLSDFIEYKGE